MIDRRRLPVLDAMPMVSSLSEADNELARAHYERFLERFSAMLRGRGAPGLEEFFSTGRVREAWSSLPPHTRAAWLASESYGNCLPLGAAVALSMCAYQHGARRVENGLAVPTHPVCASCSVGYANAERMRLPKMVQSVRGGR